MKIKSNKVQYLYMGFLKNVSIRQIVTKKTYIIAVFAIIGLLHFYRLEEFTTFLSDQGRDAIIARNIITFKHLTAIGAPTSIGQVFLGPFYYYLIAPFLLLFHFNPVGMAAGVSFLSFIGLIFIFYLIQKHTNNRTAFFFLILSGFSYVLLYLARFSWNPNLLPYFAFMILYCGYKLKETQKYIYAFLVGALFALSLQLHYLAIFLTIPLIGIFIFPLFSRHFFKEILKIILAGIGFVIFFSPLIWFDIRHEFVNSKSFLKLFTQHNVVSDQSLIVKFRQTNQHFFNHLLQTNLNEMWPLVLLLIFISCFIYLFKTRKVPRFISLHFIATISYIVFFSFLNSDRHIHYYTPIYLSFFLCMAYIFNEAFKQRFFAFISILIIGTYLVLNIRAYDFIWTKEGNNQIKHAQKIATFIGPKIGNKPYNIATWPVEFSEEDFLYFLELDGHEPVSREKYEISDQMFVFCNQEPCKVIDSPSWNINYFGKAKIEQTWRVDEIIIYKLIHAT